MSAFEDLIPAKQTSGAFADLIPETEPKKVGTIDRVKAGAAGINKGVVADLLGLPVDTAANVFDLLKAGVGTVAGLAGRPDLMPEVSSDRSGVVGSSQWIERKINEGGMGAAINNPNPQDKLSRIAHMGGRVAGASVNPNPNAKVSGVNQLANFIRGEVGGLTAGAVGEVNPEWAGVAGMLPNVATSLAGAGFRQAVHGGEAGRKVMEQRLQDFKNAGVDNPSLGLATGNRTVQGVENILSVTPGSVGVYERQKNAILEALQGRAGQIRDQASTVHGREEAGAAIQADLRGQFRDRINTTTRVLNDRVAQEVGPDFFTNPENALSTSRNMSTPVPGAPATSGGLVNPRIAAIANNLASDVVGTPIPSNPLMNTPTRYQRHDGVISDTPPGIPFQTLKNLRTSIGEEAGSTAIIGTPEQAQFKRLYGAMSEDMRQAVSAADRQNAGVPVGPLQTSQQPGATALNRANDYYSTAMNRTEALGPIANRTTPEKAYEAVAGSLASGPTVYQRLRGAVTPETRQKVVATVIDELGMAKPGQQGADGDAWSPSTFLTNYNKIDPQARAELFKRIPGGERLAADLHDVAKAADMINQSSRVWANPSGTAAATVSRGTMWGLTAGAFLEPITAATIGGSLALGNQASQRLLLNPKFVGWLAKAPKVSEAGKQSYVQMLIATANKANDPQFKRDVADYLSLVKNGSEDIQN